MNAYDNLLKYFFELVDHESLRQEAKKSGNNQEEARHQLERTRYLVGIRMFRNQGVVFDFRVYLENTAARVAELAGSVDALGSVFEDVLRLLNHLERLKEALPELLQEFERLGLDEWLDFGESLDYLHQPANQFFQLLENHVLLEEDVEFRNVETAHALALRLSLELPELLRGFLEDVVHAAAALHHDLSHIGRR